VWRKVHDCDVLVIGAGPAGSSAARAAAAAGARVLIVDRKDSIGLPVQCAEHLPYRLAHDFGLLAGSDVVAQTVSAMHTHLPDGTSIETAAPGVICYRDRFDRLLLGLAEQAGARFRGATAAVAFERGAVTLSGRDGMYTVTPAVIIGCDGPLSLVRRQLGLDRNQCVRARQELLPLSRSLDATQIYFRHYMPGGYGWVFPKGGLANVGAGVDPRFGVRSGLALATLKQELREAGVLDSGASVSVTGGLIPVGGQSRVRAGNIILAGDAAGHSHPVTGAGVPSAVFAGEMAGSAAARTAAGEGDAALSDYEEQCELFIGASWQDAVGRRQSIDRYWKSGVHELSQAVKENWIAMKEHHETVN
jgi:geranylgeranyl reductase family protein